MKKIISFLGVFSIFVIVHFGNAQTIYVNSSTGSDASGNGTAGSPYKTFHKGYTMVSSGGTLNLTGTFTWTDADETGDASTSGYTISKNLTIIGQRADQTIIQAAATQNTADRRVFTINNYTVTLQNLTIRYGYMNISSGHGVAIYASGNLTILNCIIEKNKNHYDRYVNGAIYHGGASFIMRGTTVSDNEVGYAGGFYLYSTSVEITNCTIYNNVGDYYGGLYFSSSGTINITNSTFVKNKSNYGFGANLSLWQSCNLYIKNTILADAVTGKDFDRYSGSVVHENGNNIVETQTYSDFVNGVNGTMTGNQVNLNVDTGLASNFSSTGVRTLALLSGSVAINAGATGTNNTITVPSIDQREISRVGNPDIGAFEFGIYRWKGTTSSDFNTASNWVEDIVPPTGASIMFDSPSNHCVLDQDRTVSGIVNNQSTYLLDVNGNKLSIQGSIELTNGAKIKSDATNSEIIFSGSSAQTVSASAFQNNTVYNLTVNSSSVITSNSDILVTNLLTLTNGKFSLGTGNLTIGESATISGTPSASNMIVVASTGELRKIFTGSGSFTYPVGDNTGTAEYSPITLDFTSGTFSSAYAGITLSNSKHPNNGSATDYLNRYWTVNQSGISNFSCNVTAQYVTADIVGTEENIYTGKYSGGVWILLNQADAVNHRISGTVSGFSSFTGGQQNVMPAELVSFNSAVNGRDVNLKWTTSTESNNAGFEIQKSVSGNQNLMWNKIGFVKGSGTTNIPINYSFTDSKLISGKYQYRLKQIDNNGNFKYFELNNVVEIGIPKKYSLNQNYPNPFNPKTKIEFQIPKDSKVSLIIYDITGRQVATLINNELKKADYYSVDFNASNLASGIYFYRIISGSYIETKKMTLIK